MKSKLYKIAVGIVSVFIFVLFFSGIKSQYKEVAAENITSLDTSYYKPCNFHMELIGASLVITETPESLWDNNLWFRICDEDGTCVVDDKYRKGDSKFAISLDACECGKIYRIYLYTDNAGYWWDAGAPKIQKMSDQSWTFVMGEYYDDVKKQFASLLTSEYALKFYKKPSYGIESDDKAIKSKGKEIIKNCTTDYEKVYAIYDWMIKNIAYDYDSLKNGVGSQQVDAKCVLKNRCGVCQGYSYLYAALLRSIGIPTMVVGGNAHSPINIKDHNHAWNMVYFDGKWHFFDTTWDNHTRFENGTFDDSKDNENYMWFDMTEEMVANSHYILDNIYEDVIESFNDKDESEYDLESIIDVTYGPTKEKLKSMTYILDKMGVKDEGKIEYKLLCDKKMAYLQDGMIYFTGYIGKYDRVQVNVYLVLHEKKYELDTYTYFVEDEIKKYVGIGLKQTRTLKVGGKRSFYLYLFDSEDASCFKIKQTIKHTIVYSSSNKKIATVNKKGIITAKRKGNCIITAKVKIGTRNFTYRMNLNVTK